MKIKLSFFKYLAYALEVVLLYVLQDTPKLMPELFGGKPLLLMALALSIASRENQIPSIVFGAVCGALIDLSGGAVGFFGVTLTLACFFEAEIFKKYLVPSFWTSFLYSLLSSVAIISLYFLFFRVFSGVEGAGALYVNHYISRILYTAVCFAPLYFLNKFLYKSLS